MSLQQSLELELDSILSSAINASGIKPINWFGLAVFAVRCLIHIVAILKSWDGS